ncbi:MAG: matrixin family metalloprotease [Myxococcota bacterium]
MALAAILCSFGASGCGEREAQQSNVFRYFKPAHVEEIDPAAIELTEDIFGVELVETSDPWGAVTIFPFSRNAFEGAFEPEFEVGGEASLGRCTPWVWYVTDSPLVLAHELGHAYGLGHVDEPCNVMLPRLSCEDGTFKASEQQIRIVREEAWNQKYVCKQLSPLP